MKINTDQIRTLANLLGACSLNGAPARIEPAHNGRLVRVVARTEHGQFGCVFNWSTAQHVVTHKGGRFETR